MGNSFLAECSKGISEAEQEKRPPTMEQSGNDYLSKNQRKTQKFQRNFLDESLNCPQRPIEIEKFYQQLKQQKPILYSIESKQILDIHNVQNLKQLLQKKLNSSRFSIENQLSENFRIQQVSQRQFSQKNSTSLYLDLTPESSQTNEQEFQPKIQIKQFYLKRQNERESSFSSEYEKNIIRNRSSSQSFPEFNLKDGISFEQNPDSILEFDSFIIFGKEYIYVGFLNTLGKPHGPGQLYHFDETQDPLSISTFIQAEFINGSISTNDLIIIFKDTSFYRGGFQQGTFHGKGHLKLNRNLELVGNFVFGFLEGKGKATYSDGGIYEGFFRTGIKQGKGKMIWKSQKSINNQNSLEICYEGYFKNDKMNGLGYLRTPNYEYWGPFSDNMKEGKGTIKFKDGNKFEGWFEKDEINGYGELHYANGEVQKGIFPIEREQS